LKKFHEVRKKENKENSKRGKRIEKQIFRQFLNVDLIRGEKCRGCGS